MDKKSEFNSRWQDLSKRLENDKEFDDVMKSIEDVLTIDNTAEHSRLRVPYSDASNWASDFLWLYRHKTKATGVNRCST